MKWTGVYEMLDVDRIVMDRKYQRPEKWDIIAEIARDPRPEAFGVVLCSKRMAGGKPLYYCMDGQQRLNGVLSSNEPPTQVPAMTYVVKSEAEEAELFTIMNEHRKAVAMLEKYRAHMAFNDQRYVIVTGVCDRTGFSIGPKTGGGDANTIGALGRLLKIYDEIGEEALELMLHAIHRAWPTDRDATSTLILQGVSRIVAEKRKDNGGVSVEQLRKALVRTSPGAVLRKAEEHKFKMGGSKEVNVRRALKTLCKV